jgi:hypothetical protein
VVIELKRTQALLPPPCPVWLTSHQRIARNGVTFHFGTDNAVASISVLNRIARLKWGRKMVR